MQFQNIDIQKLSEGLILVSYTRKEGLVSFLINSNLDLQFTSLPLNADISQDIVPLFYQILNLYLKDKVPLKDNNQFPKSSKEDQKKIFDLFIKEANTFTVIEVLNNYSGRYKYHGPAIIVDDLSCLEALSMPCIWDNFGKNFVVYPKI